MKIHQNSSPQFTEKLVVIAENKEQVKFLERSTGRTKVYRKYFCDICKFVAFNIDNLKTHKERHEEIVVEYEKKGNYMSPAYMIQEPGRI